MPNTARLIRAGDSQIVRLPASCPINADEVVIEAVADGLLLRPRKQPWAEYFAALEPLEDFPDDIPALVDRKPAPDLDA